jgi:ATP-dependent helicase HrpB
VAARLAARRIAQERGCAIGEEIGYQVRFEDRTGPNTRIEVLTEGLLNRRIQADPFLEQAGLVILDELHERSLHTDLALALLRELRANARPELRILAMSATLDPGPVQAYLGDALGPAPLIRAEGRTFPIELDYLPRPSDLPLWEQTAAAIRQVHDPALGHTLVFLPGVREIERTAELLALRPPTGDPPIIPLHGSLPPEAQDRALAPGGPARVVLATNLAETSVTLVGVRTVVDTGLARVTIHDPALGLDRLELQPIARDSADQRAGRAGRTAPGRCLRLWTESQELLRAPRSTSAKIRGPSPGLSRLPPH